jgi:hypothetical protein
MRIDIYDYRIIKWTMDWLECKLKVLFIAIYGREAPNELQICPQYLKGMSRGGPQK